MKDRWYANPSLGLGIWGPLVPANDCLWCRNICIGLQLAGGTLLLRRKPNASKPKWARRLIRTGTVAAGCYTLVGAGVELSRYILRSDPWYSDALIARRKNPSSSLLEDWFGPLNYRAVPFEEFVRRAGNRTVRRLSPEAIKVTMAVRDTNRKHFGGLLEKIRTNTLITSESAHIPLLDVDVPEEFAFEDIYRWAEGVQSKFTMVVYPCSGLVMGDGSV